MPYFYIFDSMGSFGMLSLMVTHLQNLRAHFPAINSKKVLDLGSGTGEFLIESALAKINISGVEVSQEYIQASQKKFETLGLQIPLIQGVGEAIPFPSNTFDIVNMAEVIEHVESPDKVLSEVFRVLKPGGGVYISVPSRFSVYDTHFHLYGINWLPRKIAHWLIGVLGKHKEYIGNIGKQRIDEMYYDSKRGFVRKAKRNGFEVYDARLRKIENIHNGAIRLIAYIVYALVSGWFFRAHHFILRKPL